MLVLDASVLVDRLLGLLDPAALAQISRGDLAAPDLLDAEAASALRGLWLGQKITDDRLHRAIDDLVQFQAARFSVSPLLPRIMQLRSSLTVYDASYVALAEALECPLITKDRRIAEAPGLRCSVEVV